MPPSPLGPRSVQTALVAFGAGLVALLLLCAALAYFGLRLP